MTNITKILANEAGIRYQGVEDKSGQIGTYPVIGMIAGYFKRGRFDKPMLINRQNIKAQLGCEPDNPYYLAVADVLAAGVPSVHVVRLNPVPQPEPQPEPQPQPEPEPPKDEHTVQEFDFAVVRYIWTDAGGLDLDTRTLISQPPRNVVVGWNKLGADGDFLSWPGDNTGSGVESVLVNISALRLAYPSQKIFTMQFRAFWYNARMDGNFRLQVETYKGGQMLINGYDYRNEGGQSVQNLFMDCSISDEKDFSGHLVAQLSLDVERKIGELIKNTGQIEPIGKTISLSDSAGISIFTDYASQLRLLNVNNIVLFDGAGSDTPLILRNSSNTIIYE